MAAPAPSPEHSPRMRVRGTSGTFASCRPPCLLLVIFCHQPIEETHAKARGPALVDVALRRAHAGASYVEMRPWRLVYKAQENLCCGDRTGVAATDILHVGELRFELLVIFGPERHPPQPFAGGEPDLEQSIGELIVVG